MHVKLASFRLKLLVWCEIVAAIEYQEFALLGASFQPRIELFTVINSITLGHSGALESRSY